MPNLKRLLTDNIYPILFTVIVLVFFYPFILHGKIPIPADTIVGMYHPFRDTVWDGNTAGVPFKNFLITDPVRQQYVWRKIAIEEFKNGKLPLWNPYSFSGAPLLANFQTAAFYPLNFLFFILPFDLAWGILIVLQPLLAGLFLYSYLRYMNISKMGSFLGALVFSFSGFTIAWLEWNTIIHTILWLPLSLLAIEKIIQSLCHSERSRGISELVSAYSRIRGMTIVWSIVFLFSLISSFFAGHLQVFFYSFLVIIVYLAAKIVLLRQYTLRILLFFVICSLLFVIITSIQWLPTLQFISNSARQFDQGSFLKEGWFLPWQNLIQFIVPDFFGNPATGNYWGIWNYGEFIGYIGIVPLIFVLYRLIFAKDKRTIFWAGMGFLALIFALPTPLAKLPFQWQIPFISTSQPTRLMVIVDFSLSILSALGFDYFIKSKNLKRTIAVLLPLGLVFLTIWLFIFLNSSSSINLLISKRNLILPTALFILSATLLSFRAKARNLAKRNFRPDLIGTGFLSRLNSFDMTGEKFTCFLLFIIIILDLFRFGWKFTPFTKEEWIFPSSKLLKIISTDNIYARFMALDRRIMPPNFSASYKIQDVSGYDPLYLKDYGQLAAAWERNKPDISPAAFNRIITPVNYESFITDLLGVKFVMSLGPLKSGKLEYLTKEGETYLYENKKVFPRVFLVDKIIKTKNSQETIDQMFNLAGGLRFTAVTDEDININPTPLQSVEETIITYYSPNYITISANTTIYRLLVLSDIYYPSWQAYIDGRSAKMYRVDFTFRGVIVPAGKHKIEFKNNLL